MLRLITPRRALAGIVLTLLLLASGPAPAVADEHRVAGEVTHDVLVLIDVTASMVSDRDGAPVWPAVSSSLTDLIGRLAPGTHVAIVPFAIGPHLEFAYPSIDGDSLHPAVIDPAVVGELQAHVAALPMDGQGTHIYESMDFALDQLARWRAETPDVTRVQTLILYTDGEDTGPHAAEGVAGLAALIDRAREDNPSLAVTYHDVVSLLEVEDRSTLESAGVQVVSVNPTPLVAIEVPVLDLGRVEAGSSVTVELQLTSAFVDAFGRRMEASLVGAEDISLSSFDSTLAPTMTVELSLSEDAPAGSAETELVLRPVDGDFAFAPIDSVILRLEAAPAAAPAVVVEPAPASAAARGELVQTQDGRPNAPVEVVLGALLGLALTSVAAVLIRRRRRQRSRTAFHRLLVRDGAVPTSILDPEARMITLTAEELARGPALGNVAGERGTSPDLDALLERATLTLRNGELHVSPRNEPLFIGSIRVPVEGRALHTGDCFRAGALRVRYDRCEVR